MKKLLLLLVSILFIVSGCSSKPASSGKLKVVASFYPLADFAQKVGGDHVEVVNLVPTGTEVHDFELSAQDKAAILESDVFVYNGVGLESWVDDLLPTLGDKVTQVDSSKGVELIHASEEHEEGHDEHEEDHDHGEYDPHIWLSVSRAKQQMTTIYEALVAADPDHKADYEANYKTYAAQFDALDQEFKTQLAGVAHHTIVVSHQAFGYLCASYGLEQVALEGIYAESEPDPKTLASVIEYMKTNSIKVVFAESASSTKLSDTISKETGAKVDVLYTIEAMSAEQVSAKEDYLSLMRMNLKALVNALS